MGGADGAGGVGEGVGPGLGLGEGDHLPDVLLASQQGGEPVPAHQFGRGGGVEGVEAEQRRARHERRVDLKVGVLGGGADQSDQAVLHRGQQRVLLGLVEPVDLVKEQDGAFAVLAQPAAGPLDGGPGVLDGGGHRGELLEGLGGGGGHHPGQGGLARPRRPPQDHRRQPVGLDQLPQRPARPDQMILAHDLVQGAGPQPSGQRSPAAQPLASRGIKQV